MSLDQNPIFSSVVSEAKYIFEHNDVISSLVVSIFISQVTSSY
jgi:hypothetical protein